MELIIWEFSFCKEKILYKNLIPLLKSKLRKKTSISERRITIERGPCATSLTLRTVPINKAMIIL